LKKLLIVDNSTLIINVLKDLFLKKNRFQIFVAKSLDEVQHLINNNKFFAAISNIVLPDALNGELLDVLESNNIPTVVLSSKIDSENIKTLNNKKIVEYILKDSIYGLEQAYKLVDLLVYMNGIEVLVVEDSSTTAFDIKAILESLLLDVKIAKNGLEAISILNDNSNISLVISDYNMPQMNGLDLTKHIRKDPRHTNLPIFLISSEHNDELKIKLFKNGINDFISKPILAEEFKTKIINIFFNLKQMDEINRFNKLVDENIITSSTDKRGIIVSASSAFCKISGYTKEELIGNHHNIVRHPDMPSSIYEELWNTIKSGKRWKGEIKNRSKDGVPYWVSSVIEPIFDRKHNITGYYAIRQDITDKKRIYELSITDGLTSLYNRRYFNDMAYTIFTNTIRNNDIFAFVLLDIDNFKKYNDTYGHQEGDNVLINVSDSLKKSFRRNDDIVFRLGGEEFGIIINAKTKEDIETLVEDARKNIESLQIKHEKNPPSLVITASFGVSILEKNESLKYSLDDIYKRTDDALYKAKENGRNRVEYI